MNKTKDREVPISSFCDYFKLGGDRDQLWLEEASTAQKKKFTYVWNVSYGLVDKKMNNFKGN